MGRRSYSGEKWRREQARKAKRDAKAERKKEGVKEGEAEGGGPPIDWDAMVGGPDTPPPAPERRSARPSGPYSPKRRSTVGRARGNASRITWSPTSRTRSGSVVSI